MRNAKPRLEVVQESETGLNQRFRVVGTGEILTRVQVANKIEDFPGYHVALYDGRRIIRSNPNNKTSDNLD
jgi:hypothetical protein